MERCLSSAAGRADMIFAVQRKFTIPQRIHLHRQETWRSSARETRRHFSQTAVYLSLAARIAKKIKWPAPRFMTPPPENSLKQAIWTTLVRRIRPRRSETVES